MTSLKFPGLLLGLVSAAAVAQGPLPNLAGREQLTGCRQGECAWTRFLEVTRAATIPQGELRRVRLRVATAPELTPRRQLRWEEERTDHVFCSRVRPAYGFETESGGFLVHYLDLYDLAGYQMASASLYMRVCHDRAPAGSAVLRRLGYRPGTRSEQTESEQLEALTRF